MTTLNRAMEQIKENCETLSKKKMTNKLNNEVFCQIEAALRMGIMVGVGLAGKSDDYGDYFNSLFSNKDEQSIQLGRVLIDFQRLISQYKIVK